MKRTTISDDAAARPTDLFDRDFTAVAEGAKVATRFRCSGTHLGEWRGQPPTGHRFEGVDEASFFQVVDAQITDAWGLEDTAGRECKLRHGDRHG